MKKLMSIFTACLFVFGLASCGGEETTTEETTTDETTTEETTTEDAAE